MVDASLAGIRAMPRRCRLRSTAPGGQEARGRSGAPRLHGLDEDAALDAQLPCDVGARRLDSQGRPHHLPPLDQLLHRFGDGRHGERKAHAAEGAAGREDGRVDAWESGERDDVFSLRHGRVSVHDGH